MYPERPRPNMNPGKLKSIAVSTATSHFSAFMLPITRIQSAMESSMDRAPKVKSTPMKLHRVPSSTARWAALAFDMSTYKKTPMAMNTIPEIMNHTAAIPAFFLALLGSASSEETIDGGMDGLDWGTGMAEGDGGAGWAGVETGGWP